MNTNDWWTKIFNYFLLYACNTIDFGKGDTDYLCNSSDKIIHEICSNTINWIKYKVYKI